MISELIPQSGIISRIRVNLGHIPFTGIRSVHQLQYPGRATLNRKMNVFADIFIFRHRVQHIICNIFGCEVENRTLNRGLINATFSSSLAKVTTVSSRPSVAARIIRIYPVIAIYILSQKCYFPITLFKKIRTFFND